MFDAARTISPASDDEIARHEVSEDGVMWRDYDPVRDRERALLHKRIVFATPPAND
jgi:hypothetical protein